MMLVRAGRRESFMVTLLLIASLSHISNQDGQYGLAEAAHICSNNDLLLIAIAKHVSRDYSPCKDCVSFKQDFPPRMAGLNRLIDG
jgi:hypothetical protein